MNNDLSGKISGSIANNLTTTDSGYVLDARQGKTLNDNKANKTWTIIIVNVHITTSLNYSLPTAAKNANEIILYVGIPTINNSRTTIFIPKDYNMPIGYVYGEGSYKTTSILHYDTTNSKIICAEETTTGWSSGVASILNILYR